MEQSVADRLRIPHLSWELPGGEVAPPRPIKRRRILVSAFSISPCRGSEPGVGWNVCTRLAQYHDVTVLCRPSIGDENHRQEIETYLHEHGPIDGLTIKYVEPPRLSRWFQRPRVSFRTPLYFVGYAAWQRAAYALAMQLHREAPFDLAHQLTITGFREPGCLYQIGVPFFWGPVAGAADVPWYYFSSLGWRDRFFYGTKNLINAVHKRAKFRSRRAARAAAHIWVSADADRRLVREVWRQNCEMMVETGATAPCGDLREFDDDRPLRMIWSGLHIGRKGLPLLLHAMALLRRSPCRFQPRLTVLGAGRESLAWKALALKLGVADAVDWKGHLPREQALEEMSRSDVFLLTSIQEATSSVIMEALSLALPVICHDACGMGIAVTATCGIKIPMVGTSASIQGFADAILRIISDPSELRRLSQGARRRATELSWDRKVSHIAQTYERVLERVQGVPQ
jgi:glycosyltransferase involved in cell wall biosynthesis